MNLYGLYFKKNEKIICLEIDPIAYQVVNRTEVQYNYAHGKTEQQYITEMSAVTGWLQAAQGNVIYRGPRLSGQGPRQTFQQIPMDPGEDSKAIVKIISRAITNGVRVQRRDGPKVTFTSEQKGVVEACYLVKDATDVDLITAMIKGNNPYPQVIEVLRNSAHFQEIKALIENYLPAGARKRIGFSSRIKCIQRFTENKTRAQAITAALNSHLAQKVQDLAAQNVV